MASSGQPAYENEYRSCLDFFFDVGCGMTVIQQIRLQAEQRNRRIVRNTVEVHHRLYMFWATSPLYQV